MPNIIHFYKANPVEFYPINPVVIPQYLSTNYVHNPYMDTIKPWETKRPYSQPWMQADNIRIQVETNYGPVMVKLMDQDGRIWYNQNMLQMGTNADDPAWKIHELNLPLNEFTEENIYYLVIDDVWISEPLKILAIHKNTLLWQYKHRRYNGDVVWETGFAPSIRVRATIQLESPSSKDTFFEDQPLNLTLEDSKPFDALKLSIGGASGIPDWLASKLNRILGMSTLLIDGIEYTKTADKLEPSGLAGYPMRSWSIGIREKYNRATKTYEDNEVVRGRTSMVVTVNGKAFSLNSGNSSEQQISIIV